MIIIIDGVGAMRDWRRRWGRRGGAVVEMDQVGI
jgi:hypothetical protein